MLAHEQPPCLKSSVALPSRCLRRGPAAAMLEEQRGPAQQMPPSWPCRDTETGILQLIASQYLAALIVGFVNSATVQPILALERPVMYREMGAGLFEHSWSDSCTGIAVPALQLCIHCAPLCLKKCQLGPPLSRVVSCAGALCLHCNSSTAAERLHAALSCTVTCSS